MYPTQALQLYPAQSTVQATDVPQMMRFSDLDDIWISAKSPEMVSTAIDQVTGLLRDRHALRAEQPPDFRLRDLTEISESLASTSKADDQPAAVRGAHLPGRRRRRNHEHHARFGHRAHP